jgi:Family of unknown function (DUF6069)
MSEPTSEPRTGQLDPARLWSGGVATAVVAALIAVVGILLSRGVLDVPVLAPKGEGVWGNANTVTYALVAGAVALAATGLMQLLSVTTPRFPTFFTWIMVLLTAIAVVVPLSLPVEWAHKLATAIINLVIGIAITSILNGVARSAYRRVHRPPPGGEPGPTGAPGMPWQST